MPKTRLADVCLTSSLETEVGKGQTHSESLTDTKHFKLRIIPNHRFLTWVNLPVNLNKRAIKHWSRLPRLVVESQSVEAFQRCEDVALRDML